MRSITPPRSISETPAHIVAHSETPLATSAAVKRDPPGMMRGVTPAKGVSTANLYGGHAPPSTHTEAGKSRQGRTGRSILPPAPFANEFGGSAYDSSAMMMQHAKVAHDMTKDPEPTREHLYGMDAIKAHAIEQPSHATPAGNRRSISPPKSISEHPSNGTVGNSLMASQKVDRDVIGNRRQVTPPPGVSAANHYGESVKSPQGLEKDAQTIGSPNHRQITPPPAINLAGSGVVDGGAFMEQHVKAVSEVSACPAIVPRDSAPQ